MSIGLHGARRHGLVYSLLAPQLLRVALLGALACAMTPTLAQTQQPQQPQPQGNDVVPPPAPPAPNADLQQTCAAYCEGMGVADKSLKADAPQTYTVQRGDTLWSIAQRYLKNPELWPQLWNPNRQDIPDPNRIAPGQTLAIYAGQTIALSKDRRTGRTYLRFGRGATDTLPTVKLSPRERLAEPEPVRLISLAELEPFFVKPLVVEPDDLQRNPRIVAIDEQRVMAAGGEYRVFVRGDLRNYGVDPIAAGRQRRHVPNEYLIYRPAEPIRQPLSHQLLAYESEYIGYAKLEKANQPPDNVSTMLIIRSEKEVQVGDYLLPKQADLAADFNITPLKNLIQGNVVKVFNGVDFVARNSVVVLDRGAKQGLVPGNVLTLWRLPGTVRDTLGSNGSGKANKITLPAINNGSMLVFRVFENVAYALVTTSQLPANVGDVYTTPVEE